MVGLRNNKRRLANWTIDLVTSPQFIALDVWAHLGQGDLDFSHKS
jgi:hypothetical protein